MRVLEKLRVNELCPLECQTDLTIFVEALLHMGYPSFSVRFFYLDNVPLLCDVFRSKLLRISQFLRLLQNSFLG